MNFLNRPWWLQWLSFHCPSQPTPPSRKHLSHLSTLASGWSDLLGLHWVGRGPALLRIVGLVLIRAL